MIRHWIRGLRRIQALPADARAQESAHRQARSYRKGLAINSVGATMTVAVLIIVTITKFTHGAWIVVPPVLAFVHFLVPFAILLSRRWKRSPVMLGSAAALLLGAQWLYAAWVMLPAFPRTGPAGLALAVALSGAAAGLWASCYLAGVRRSREVPA